MEEHNAEIVGTGRTISDRYKRDPEPSLCVQSEFKSVGAETFAGDRAERCDSHV